LSIRRVLLRVIVVSISAQFFSILKNYIYLLYIIEQQIKILLR